MPDRLEKWSCLFCSCRCLPPFRRGLDRKWSIETFSMYSSSTLLQSIRVSVRAGIMHVHIYSNYAIFAVSISVRHFNINEDDSQSPSDIKFWLGRMSNEVGWGVNVSECPQTHRLRRSIVSETSPLLSGAVYGGYWFALACTKYKRGQHELPEHSISPTSTTHRNTRSMLRTARASVLRTQTTVTKLSTNN